MSISVYYVNLSGLGSEGSRVRFPAGSFRVAGLALRLAGRFQDKWTSSTGNSHMKRRDITEQL